MEYIKKMIAQEQEALSRAKDPDVRAAIKRRLDSFVKDLFDYYVGHCISEPNFAEVSILWKDSGERCDKKVIALNDTPKQFKEEDEHVFFYADGIDGLCRLASADNGVGFVILPETVNFFEKL